MANEYIFFDASLRDRFMRFAAARGVAGTTRPDAMEGHVVALPDTIDDDEALVDALETEYEALMDEQQALVEAEEATQTRDLLGVAVTLPDGSPCTVRLPAALARRLFAAFSVEEIHELVAAVASSVANPNDGPICRDI